MFLHTFLTLVEYIKKGLTYVKLTHENYMVNFKPISNTLEMDFQKGL
jgi:hypothetical protein